jgi:ceramide glucosyltransferase
MIPAEICLRVLAYGTGIFTIIYAVVCVFAAKRFKDLGNSFSLEASKTFLPPISILKPIKDVERGMYSNLASFLSQDYPKFQVLFSLQNPDDPALEILERLRRNFPDVDMEIVVSKNRIGYNPKINNISNAYPFAKYDFLMISDSDIRVDKDLLRRVVTPMSDPSVGLVTCLYRSDGGTSPGSILEALSINAQFLPNTLVAGFLLRLRFALGAVMLARRSAFEASGGLQNLSNHLADDYILGHSILAAGYRLAFCNAIVNSVPSFHTFSEALSHLIRWARTIRVCQPAGYIGVFLLHSLPLILLHILLFGPTYPMVALGLLVILARYGAITWIHRRYLNTPNLRYQLPWIPLSDLFQFGIWMLGFRSGAVLWRGVHYEIGFSGRLVPRKRASPAASAAMP